MPILRKETDLLKWGLVPFWSKEPRTKYNLINARAESIESKPSFREAFKKRRCIIVSNGFYEWKKGLGGKQPYFIRPSKGDYFYFAGIWEKWEKDEELLKTFAIITTSPNKTMEEIHNRMPVILSQNEAQHWLQEANKKLLRPCGNDELRVYPVSKAVNSPNNNYPGLMKPLHERDIKENVWCAF